MTPEELKRLRELCERATPGPWVGNEFEMLAPKAPTLIPGNVKIVWAEDHHMDEWDAEFIAAAREALPKLLDELDIISHERNSHKLLSTILTEKCTLFESQIDSLKAAVAENKKTIKAMDLIRQQQNREIADLRKERDSLKAQLETNTNHFFENQRHLTEQLVEAKQERDRALARVEKLEKAIREHHELWRNSHGVCFVECKIVCKALAEDDKEAGGCQE